MIIHIIITLIIFMMVLMFLYRKYINLQLNFIVPIIKKSQNVLYVGENTILINKLEKIGFKINQNKLSNALIINDNNYDVHKIPYTINKLIVIGKNKTISKMYKSHQTLKSFLIPNLMYYKINQK